MKNLIPLCVAATVLAACGREPSSTSNDTPDTTAPQPSEAATPPPAPSQARAAAATVQLAPTQGHNASGTLTLTADGSALHVTGTLQGLPPNAEFGFHIHEKGDCSAPDASSAGGHFNPLNAQHGNPAEEAHHAGDMLNAKSDGQGAAQVDARASAVTLNSGQPNDVLGKAVVLHEKPDDYASQPSGNSGARIACGVITGG